MNFRPIRILAVFVAIIASTSLQTTSPPRSPAIRDAIQHRPIKSAIRDAIQHRPIKPYLDKHGQALRNVQNSIVTPNWSGYAVANFETSLYYSSASATWQIPDPKWGSTSGNPYGYEYNSMWVGIGGFCENSGCSTADQELIQLGTEQTVTQSGAITNYVWYELYPQVAEPISYPVNVGDIITASLECTANCTPGQSQTWQLSITDQTLGWTWTQTFTYAASMLSAEWILEAPYYSGYLPLNNFAQANFSPVVADGLNPNLSLTTNSIVGEDPYGQTSNPSVPNNGDWFGTCWGYGSLTPCTAASFGSAAPTASLAASPSSISSGASSTLAWDSVNATACSGSGFSGSGTSGSAVVHPTGTTTYGVTCSGAGGSATAHATVTVDGPTASLAASPTSISSGGSSTLSWSSTGATSCSGNGFTASATSGSVVVHPTTSTTYSVTCSASSGSATASATVQIKTHAHKG